MKRGATMLAPERRKLSYLVRKFILANGGSEGNDYANHVGYTLPTAAGELSVTYDRGWGTIFGRFEDVEAAKKLLGTGPYNRLNPYSGKWNFHFGRVTAEAAFEQWTGALKVYRLLPVGAEGAHTGRWSGTKSNQGNTPKTENALTPKEAEALEAAARYFLLLRETGKRPDDVAALESALVKLERIQRLSE